MPNNELENSNNLFMEYNIKDIKEDKDYTSNKKLKVLKKNKKE